ncbi:MAG: B12-binding domain-containing radical SAM protein [Proteobacteria bacterium]|nr:B12-binding domain-containing radical SAM protein [Pseudomonadota bacterium]
MSSTGPEPVERVLLVHPPSNRVVRPDGERGLKACVPPLGLAYLAGVLRRSGFEVRVLDCVALGYDDPEIEVEPDIFRYGLSDGAIAEAVADFGPDLVGITCPQAVRLPEALAAARQVKAWSPEVPVVMGGAAVSALESDLFRHTDDVDMVVKGEGEGRLLDLLAALPGGKSELQKVDGLIYRDEGRVLANPARVVIEDIDALPLPAWDLLPMETYFRVNRNPSVHAGAGRTCLMITSRGCPHRCYYCPVHNVFGPRGPRFRMRSIESVLSEIDLLTSRYGVEEIQFEDANFNASIERTIALSRAIGQAFPGLRWSTPHGNQTGTLTPAVMSAMRQGGCHALHLAIESADQDFLNRRKKTVRLSHMEGLIKRAKDMGFFVSTFFMIGFPEDTPERIEATIDYLGSLDVDDAHIFIAVPFPGTEMHRMCEAENLLSPQASWRHFRYSWGVIRTEHFTPERLQAYRRSGWQAFWRNQKTGSGILNPSRHEREVYG